MRSSLTFLALLVIVAGANAGLVHDEKLIDAINRDPSSTYVAGVSKRFNGVDLEEARRLLGLDLSRAPEETLPVKRYSEEVKTSLPDSFDAREQWPNYIHPIRYVASLLTSEAAHDIQGSAALWFMLGVCCFGGSLRSICHCQ